MVAIIFSDDDANRFPLILSIARRAFPCWDEPSAKATFAIALVIPSELTALSNTPIERMTAVEPEEVTIYFEKTPIMSTYVSCFRVDFPQQKDFPH